MLWVLIRRGTTEKLYLFLWRNKKILYGTLRPTLPLLSEAMKNLLEAPFQEGGKASFKELSPLKAYPLPLMPTLRLFNFYHTLG